MILISIILVVMIVLFSALATVFIIKRNRKIKSVKKHYYSFLYYAEDENDDIMIYAGYTEKLSDSKLEDEKVKIGSNLENIKIVSSAVIYMGYQKD